MRCRLRKLKRLVHTQLAEQPKALDDVDMESLHRLVSRIKNEQSRWTLSIHGKDLTASRITHLEPTPVESSKILAGKPMGVAKPFDTFLDVEIVNSEQNSRKVAWNLAINDEALNFDNATSVVIRFTIGVQQWTPKSAPPWADCYGWDQYGIYAEFQINKARFKLRWIPRGSFLMGSQKDETERMEREGPIHRVEIKRGFWLGETPVTQRKYRAVAGENPSKFKKVGLEAPVESVDWNQTHQFCYALSAKLDGLENTAQFRLPSEAEWEYACRAGSNIAIYEGNAQNGGEREQLSIDQVAWFSNNSDGHTHPVREKAANPWGVFDMLGNVFEWCEDEWHKNYTGAPTDGSAWVDSEKGGRRRVFRGGSWGGCAWGCRSAYRSRTVPDYRDPLLGYRLLLAHSETEGSPSLEQAGWGSEG